MPTLKENSINTEFTGKAMKDSTFRIACLVDQAIEQAASVSSDYADDHIDSAGQKLRELLSTIKGLTG